MRILITGGAGFIGSALARRLLSAGHEVRLLDPLTPQVHGDVPAFQPIEGTTLIRADVREIVEQPEVLDGIDVVYHLAAETGTGQSMYQIRNYVDVNDLGTATLLQAISNRAKKPSQFILASSRAVYGEGAYVALSRPGEIVHPRVRTLSQLKKREWDFVDEHGERLSPTATPEDTFPHPGSVYAATKIAQEFLVSSACRGLGVRTAILRFQNVFGEGQSLQNPYTGILSIFFNRARQGLDLNIYEDGLESRDFVHISDVVEALFLALGADHPFAIYNVGSGVPISMLDAAERLLEVTGFTAELRVSGDFRVGDIRHCYADIGRIRAHLGFEPRVTFVEGLARFFAWARTQPAYQDKSDEVLTALRAHGLTNV